MPTYPVRRAPLDSPLVMGEIADGGGLPVAQAAKMFPGARGRPTDPSTLYRWASEGVPLPGGGRAFLELCRVGCRYYTSRAAVLRFIAAQNGGSAPAAEATPKPPPEGKPSRGRQIADAEKKLHAAGV